MFPALALIPNLHDDLRVKTTDRSIRSVDSIWLAIRTGPTTANAIEAATQGQHLGTLGASPHPRSGSPQRHHLGDLGPPGGHIDPTRLGDYAGAELAFTQLTVLDTLEVMLVETTEKLELKSRRLKWALVSLTTGAVLTALDLLLG